MHKELIDFFVSGQYITVDALIEMLVNCDIEECKTMCKLLEDKTLEPADIPQYSNFENGTIEIISCLRKTGDYGLSFDEIGQHFLSYGHKNVAYKKYGENHSKLAELFGLVTITKRSPRKVYLTPIGKYLESMATDEQMLLLRKLSFRMAVVRFMIKNDIDNRESLETELRKILAESTALRRTPNAWRVYCLAKEGKI